VEPKHEGIKTALAKGAMMITNYAEYTERYGVNYEYEFDEWRRKTGGDEDSTLADCEHISYSELDDACACDLGGFCILEGKDLSPFGNCDSFNVVTE
jgi:hypothetical protein